MNMADYSQEIIGARDAIVEAGILCALRRNAVTDLPVPVLLTKVDPKLVDGELIRFTDTSALLPGGLVRNPDPEVDKLVIPACDLFPTGDVLRIVTATPTAPSGEAIIWELVLRK